MPKTHWTENKNCQHEWVRYTKCENQKGGGVGLFVWTIYKISPFLSTPLNHNSDLCSGLSSLYALCVSYAYS